MNEWAGFFLGIMAFAAVVQCAFLVIATISLRTSARRVNELCEKFAVEIKPTLEDLRKGAANLRAISESGREQAARVETAVSSTLANIESTIEGVRSMVAKPLSTVTELSALWGGLRSGFEAYRTAEPKRRSPPGTPRRSEDSDEHLFIG